jgi:hypothetical protein
MQCSALRKNGHVVIKSNLSSSPRCRNLNHRRSSVQNRRHVHFQNGQARPRQGPSCRHRCESHVWASSIKTFNSIQIFTGKKLVSRFPRTRGINVQPHSYRKISALPPTTWMSPTSTVLNTSSYALPFSLPFETGLISAHV